MEGAWLFLGSEGWNQKFSFGHVKLDIQVVMLNRHLCITREVEARFIPSVNK